MSAVDFRFSPEDEAFRDEVRTWLHDNLTGEYAALGGRGGPADETGWDVRMAWEKVLGAAGWRVAVWADIGHLSVALDDLPD